MHYDHFKPKSYLKLIKKKRIFRRWTVSFNKSPVTTGPRLRNVDWGGGANTSQVTGQLPIHYVALGAATWRSENHKSMAFPCNSHLAFVLHAHKFRIFLIGLSKGRSRDWPDPRWPTYKPEIYKMWASRGLLRSEGFIQIRVSAGHWQRCKVVIFLVWPCIDLRMTMGFKGKCSPSEIMHF